MEFLESMFRKGPRYTLVPRHSHDPTVDTPAATDSKRRDSPSEFHLPPPATPSVNYLLPIRSRKQRFGRTQTSDTVRSLKAPTAMGCTDKSDFKKPSASGVGNKNSCHLQQESKWTNPGMLQRIWYSYNTLEEVDCYNSYNTTLH